MSVPAFRVARSRPMHRYVLVGFVLIVAALASVPLWAENSVMRTLVTFFTLLALAQMWNLLGGYAGLISVGQQAYVGIGAYGVWYLSDVVGLHPFLSAILAGFIAVVVALGVAPLIFRLRGGYFAIGTWVVAEVCRIIISNWDAAGSGSGKAILSAARMPVTTRIPATYWLALAVAVGAVLLVYLLLRTRTGLALTAIRDNDLAAQSSGVNVFRSKLYVYLVSAFGCGVVGGVVALNLLWIQPTSAFSINWTAYAIFIVVIGGFATHRRSPPRGGDLLRPAADAEPVRRHVHAAPRRHRRDHGHQGAARHLGVRREALGPAPVPGQAPAGARSAAAG